MNASALSASDLTSLARSSINSSMQIPQKINSGRFNRQIVASLQSPATAHLSTARPIHKRVMRS